LFLQPHLKLPNLFVGLLTRDSILSAVSKGITAHQIISYLRANSHPKALSQVIYGVPETVVDQIEAWAAERTRISFMRDVAWIRADTKADYDIIFAVAKERDELQFSNETRRQLLVSKSCVEVLQGKVALRIPTSNY
jgi:transcription initiation factor TFIIH subunit 4